MSSSTIRALTDPKTWQLLSAGAGLYLMYQFWVLSDAPNAASRQAKSKSKTVLTKLGKTDLQLSEHEAILAAEIIHSDQLSSQFEDVGGLEDIVEQLKESVIFPLVYPQLFDSAAGLFGAPKGVLLYGPPGCGKTLLARALARESGATFINIRASMLQDKWFGESNKLVSALFSLARKLQPAIIFIDEIDAFLRERASSDHEVSSMLKAEFMSCWDGLLTEGDRIMVLGATNRPTDIDAAILRRMPKKFSVPLPGYSQRKSILALLLRDIPLDPSLDLDDLAANTNGMSGSDLKELCRQAAGMPIKEQMRRIKGKTPAEVESISKEGFTRRPLTIEDFDTQTPLLSHNTSLPDVEPRMFAF